MCSYNAMTNVVFYEIVLSLIIESKNNIQI